MAYPWPDNEMPIPGIYTGITADEYHRSPGISVSKLKKFAHCPWKARFGDQTETTAQAFGTLMHSLLLEPDTVKDHYQVTREDRRNTKGWEQDQQRAMGRTLVKSSDWALAHAMRNAILAQRSAQYLLKYGPDMLTEVSFYWIDPETGLLCRGRCDIVRIDIGTLGDLKTCDDASELGWRHSMETWGYDLQSAFYQWGFQTAPNGWKPDQFLFLPAEKEDPWKANLWFHDLDQQPKALTKCRMLLREWARCEDSGIWPGYSDWPESISLSPWRYKE